MTAVLAEIYKRNSADAVALLGMRCLEDHAPELPNSVHAIYIVLRLYPAWAATNP